MRNLERDLDALDGVLSREYRGEGPMAELASDPVLAEPRAAAQALADVFGAGAGCLTV